jgi:integrase
MMGDAGLSARAAADQLGHSKVSMTQDKYMKRRVSKTGAAGILESIADAE